MHTTTKIWIGVGAFLLATTSPLSLSVGGNSAMLSSDALAAPPKAGEGGEGGESAEGGEGGEGGSLPATYKLNSSDPKAFDYDARPQIDAYATLLHATYEASHAAALELKAAIDALLVKPSRETLAKARFAWINGRIPYLQTEAFRFYDGPIDFADAAKGVEGPEGHINAWPLNEAFIDSVKGNAKAGLINDRSFKITRASILEKDQVTDEADVTTGWHAIEFLLWGQDLDPYGPGQRTAADYELGKGANDRRRLYLQTITGMLVDDLAGLTAAWAPGKPDNYAARFRAMDQREALGRMLAGISTLAGFEMMSERLAVSLDSGDQEDEHSCFSDTTTNDFIYDLRGIRNVWLGNFRSVDGPGLDQLVGQIDPALNAKVIGLLDHAEQAIAAIPQPFDQMLAAGKDSLARAKAEAAVVALKNLGEGFKEVGTRLGVLVLVPTATN